jgi:hypothetical protein
MIQVKRLTVAGTALLCLLAVLVSCATGRFPEGRKSGIKGRVLPVDASGEVISPQDKEQIIVNCFPVRNGTPLPERSITDNARDDGSFSVDLREGKYLVEFFLEGFYVKSMYVSLEGKKKKNLGDIPLERIETDTGLPVRDDGIQGPGDSGGDVTIQPPVY